MSEENTLVANMIMDTYHHLGVREHEGLVVVHFGKHPTLDGWTAREIGNELCDVAGRPGCRNLLLDFSEVIWLASAMLEKLVTVHRTMESKGGKLTFRGVGPGIQEMFALTKLDQLFNISSNEADVPAASGMTTEMAK